MQTLRFADAGDAAMLVELPPGLDARTNAHAIALARAVGDRCAPHLRDVVVGFHTVTLYFDPLVSDRDWLENQVRAINRSIPESAPVGGRLIEVPVRYGGEFGPDLVEVASATHLSEAEVVAIHAGATYVVYMMGFVPGFAYMARVDPRISLARRQTPRERVAAGSVAIAAGQTAIYPIETPGGWHVIGRTVVKAYDPLRADPFLFHPGDRVRFAATDSAPTSGMNQ
jgi:KipI family sensor histidine kinase inhibitor